MDDEEKNAPNTWFVPGTPRPQGSKKLFGRKMVEASKYVGGWRDAVATVSRAKGPKNIPPPYHVDIEFLFDRPKSHYGTGRNQYTLKDSAPVFHTSKPDGDKLVRAVFDALVMGKIVDDDCLIASHKATKRYVLLGEKPGVKITVSSCAD